MKKLKENRLNKFLLGILILSIFSLTIGANELSAGVCEKALMRCLAEAGAAGLGATMGGAAAGMPWIGLLVWAGQSGFCIDGYFWCLAYYEH